MSAISDYVAAATVLIKGVSDDVATFATQKADLNSKLDTALATIVALQNSPGTITPADQALLDTAQAQLTAAKAAADALVVPVVPPPPKPPTP